MMPLSRQADDDDDYTIPSLPLAPHPVGGDAPLEPVPEYNAVTNSNNSAMSPPSIGITDSGSAGGLSRRPSILKRIGGKLAGSRRYEGMDDDEGMPAAFQTSSSSHATAMRQLQYSGGGPLASDDQRLLEVRAAFEANYGPPPASMQRLFNNMPDRGLALMESYLYEHNPRALPAELAAEIADARHHSGDLIATRRAYTVMQPPSVGNGSGGVGSAFGAAGGSAGLAVGAGRVPSMWQPSQELRAGGAPSSASSPRAPMGGGGGGGGGGGRPPMLTRSNTLVGGETKKMLQKMVSQNGRWSELAGMVMQVLDANLQLAKQQRGGDAGELCSAAAPALALSPSLQAELDLALGKAPPQLMMPVSDQVPPWYEDGSELGEDPLQGQALREKCTKRVKVHWVAALLAVLYVCALGFYFTFRAVYTLPGLGNYLAYGIVVLAVELLGGLAILPYALTSCFSVISDSHGGNSKGGFENGGGRSSVSGSLASNSNGFVGNGGGGYRAEEEVVGTALLYHVRVLIPCYKEPVDVVGKTLLAALQAVMPPHCRRTVYLCDDGRSPDKRRFIESLGRADVKYVTGRDRPKGETNGKSGNLNNVIRSLYPPGQASRSGSSPTMDNDGGGADAYVGAGNNGARPGGGVPHSEVLCILDADQVCSPHFFTRLLPLMDGGRDVAMVLSPQCFYNTDLDADIFNHANVPFWHYTQVGYDALGIISCTGTNFLVRSGAIVQAGGFPEYTLTEDFALGIRLKEDGWQCRYVDEHLAIGEAPENTRNCFQQRSRWAKGHMQLFWSWRYTPLLSRKLGLFPRLMYCSVLLNYFAAFIGTPVMLVVPMVTAWVGVFPLIVNWQAATAITVYYFSTTLVIFYSRNFDHLKAHFFALVSTPILWFAYLKALWRATIGRLMSGSSVFKVTLKGGKGMQQLASTGIQDVWPSMLSLTALITTFVIGCIQLASGPVSSPIVISMCWMAYNMVPPALLLYYWTLHNCLPRRALRYLCFFGRLFSFTAAIAGVVLLWPLLPNGYGDYSEPAATTTQFYGSQMSGKLPASFNASYPKVTWRSDAQLGDGQVLLLNASLAGNYTDWLLRSGYFDGDLPVDVASELGKLAEAATLQKSRVGVLEDRHRALVSSLTEAVRQLSSSDPSTRGLDQLRAESEDLAAQISSYEADLQALANGTKSAAEGARGLRDQAANVTALLQETEPERLPVGRLAAHKLVDRLARARKELWEQAEAMDGFGKGAEEALEAAREAVANAQKLVESLPESDEDGGDGGSTTDGSTEGNNRRRLLQDDDSNNEGEDSNNEDEDSNNEDNSDKDGGSNDKDDGGDESSGGSSGMSDEELLRRTQELSVQMQEQQIKAMEETLGKKKVDAEARRHTAAVAASLRAVSNSLRPAAFSLQEEGQDLQALAEMLSSLPNAAASSGSGADGEAGDSNSDERKMGYQVKLEDVYSRSLWNDASRYVNATLGSAGEKFDLEGGFFTSMGAANLKATSPIAFTTAMLSLAMLSFPEQLRREPEGDAAGIQQWDALLAAVRHGAKYLLKVHVTGTTKAANGTDREFEALISRVGFVDKEALFWTRPEDTDEEGRPAFAITAEQGASDLAGLVAGGLAAAATVLGEAGDKDDGDGEDVSRDELIAAAERAMAFGTSKMRSMSDTDVDLRSLYNSSSYLDDLAWGAAWLHRATNKREWLTSFAEFGALHLSFEQQAAATYAFDWDNTFWGANVVLAQAPGVDNSALPGLLNNTETFLKRWMCGGDDQIALSTSRGLMLHPNITLTGVTANAAMVSAIMGKALPDDSGVDGGERQAYTCWALAQVRYMIGDAGHSLVGGYGKDAPTYAQDPGVACAGGLIPCNTFTTLYSPRDNGPPLAGGLITGPNGITDDIEEDRWNGNSRVGIENNAGLTGALAGVVGLDAGHWQKCQQISGAVRMHPVCGTSFVL